MVEDFNSFATALGNRHNSIKNEAGYSRYNQKEKKRAVIQTMQRVLEMVARPRSVKEAEKNGRRLQACRNGDKHRPDRDRHLSRQPQPFLAGTLSRNHAGNQRFQIGCSLDEGRSQCEIGRDAADGFAGGERAVFAV